MKNFIKFCIVGIFNTAVTFFVFCVLNQVLKINYLISSFAGYAAGVLNSFILNKRWTFRNTERKVITQLAKFTALNIVSLTVNMLVIYLCVSKFNITEVISQVIATGFTTVVNYLGSKILVFRIGQADR